MQFNDKIECNTQDKKSVLTRKQTNLKEREGIQYFSDKKISNKVLATKSNNLTKVQFSNCESKVFSKLNLNNNIKNFMCNLKEKQLLNFERNKSDKTSTFFRNDSAYSYRMVRDVSDVCHILFKNLTLELHRIHTPVSISFVENLPTNVEFKWTLGNNVYLKYRIDCWLGTDLKLIKVLIHIIVSNCDEIMIKKILDSQIPFKFLLELIKSSSKLRQYFLINYDKICLNYIKKKERYEFIIYHLNKVTIEESCIFSQKYLMFKEDFYKCAVEHEYLPYVKKYDKLNEIC